MFCHAFGEHGRVVVVADLSLVNAQAVAAEIRAAGGTAVAVGVDVSGEDSTASMVRAAEAEAGAIEVLINNAALFSTLRMGPVH